MNDELLGCPFCGWNDPVWQVERYASDWIVYAAHCANCDAQGKTADTKQEAATAWNRRAQSTIPLGENSAQPQPPAMVGLTRNQQTLFAAVMQTYIREMKSGLCRSTPEHIAECEDALTALDQQQPAMVALTDEHIEVIREALHDSLMLYPLGAWEDYVEWRTKIDAVRKWLESQPPAPQAMTDEVRNLLHIGRRYTENSLAFLNHEMDMGGSQAMAKDIEILTRQLQDFDNALPQEGATTHAE